MRTKGSSSYIEVKLSELCGRFAPETVLKVSRVQMEKLYGTVGAQKMKTDEPVKVKIIEEDEKIDFTVTDPETVGANSR